MNWIYNKVSRFGGSFNKKGEALIKSKVNFLALILCMEHILPTHGPEKEWHCVLMPVLLLNPSWCLINPCCPRDLSGSTYCNSAAVLPAVASAPQTGWFETQRCVKLCSHTNNKATLTYEMPCNKRVPEVLESPRCPKTISQMTLFQY